MFCSGSDRRAACELLVEFRSDSTKHTPGSHSAKIYVLELTSAFA
uniref:Uncharacterized protein n=1 Tax=Plectus sambesii TaxID=2011161 RepID=A0A914VMM8_9BILA